jgi:hypothetical protein
MALARVLSLFMMLLLGEAGLGKFGQGRGGGLNWVSIGRGKGRKRLGRQAGEKGGWVVRETEGGKGRGGSGR